MRSPLPASFAPSSRFFLRIVPVAPEAPAQAQVELALEGMAPFPLAQLFWGFCLSADRRQALVFAAHRRRFSPEEMDGWPRAELVVPDALPLLAGAAPSGPGVYLWENGNQLAGAAWTDPGTLPAAVQARVVEGTIDDAVRRQFAAELAGRAGLKDAPVQAVTGRPQAHRRGDRLYFEMAGEGGTVTAGIEVGRSDLDLLDIRDRALLHERQRERRQREFTWRLLLAGGALAGLAVLCELAGLGLALSEKLARGRIAEQAAVVQRLETAQGLTSRVDELTNRRLRFFEMLAVVNEARPGSIQFTRTGNAGRNGLEIEAATASADDVNRYETALGALAALDHVEVSELQSREGRTTFNLNVIFKPELPGAAGGVR